MRSHTSAAFVLAASTLASTTHAQVVRSWTNPAGGTYNVAANWSGGVPTALDTAFFNLGSATPYSVFGPVPTAPHVARLIVGNDKVRFDGFAQAYQVTDAGNSVIVGDQAGDDALLTLMGSAPLRSPDGLVGNAPGSTGLVRLSPSTNIGSSWVTTGDLTVGGHGQGSIDVGERSGVLVQNLILGRSPGSSGSITVAGRTFANVGVRGNAYIGGGPDGPGGTGFLDSAYETVGLTGIGGNLFVYPGGTVYMRGAIGRMNVSGNADMAGRLMADVGGQLMVTGSAALSGNLDLNITAAFLQNPPIGQHFTVLTANGGVTGQFANAPGGFFTDTGAVFTVAYSPISVILTLTAVPSPSGLAAIVLAGCMLTHRRRRSR